MRAQHQLSSPETFIEGDANFRLSGSFLDEKSIHPDINQRAKMPWKFTTAGLDISLKWGAFIECRAVIRWGDWFGTHRVEEPERSQIVRGQLHLVLVRIPLV